MDWLADPVWAGISGLLTLFALVLALVQYRKTHAPGPGAESGSPSTEVHALVGRLMALFKAHGIERTQIPRFLGPEAGVTLEMLAEDEKLIRRLDDSFLDAVCTRFAVNREWLDGESETIYPVHDYYKDPEGFARFLNELKEANPDGLWYGCVYREKQPSRSQLDTLIVIDEVIGRLGERDIVRHHLIGNWVYSYWKSRAYLAACVGIARSSRVMLRGREAPRDWMQNHLAGRGFIRVPRAGAKGLWQPEDLLTDAEEYSRYLRHGHDRQAALQRWLELFELGYMRLGDEAYSQERRAGFKSALKAL